MLQHSVRMDRLVRASDRWIASIPGDYRNAVLGEADTESTLASEDPYRLALIKHYRSLMPMAQEVHKPIFHLKPADGAIGAHVRAVQSAYIDFKQLALAIAERVGLPSV